MADGKSLALSEIADSIVKKGFAFGEKSPRRSVHFALLGMRQGKVVARTLEGRWKLRDAADDKKTEEHAKTKH